LLLTIDKLVYGGEGLAHLPADEHGPGKAIFAPFALEGEDVEASLIEDKRGFARARIDRVLRASSYRVAPPCPYFQSCGGCNYQHASYEHQLAIKAAILKESLRRIAKIELDSELLIHPSPPWNYRNRARLRVQSEPEFALGYYQFNSHQLLPVEQCPISSPLINRAMADLWQAGRMRNLPREIQEIELFANAEDDQLLVNIYCVRAIAVETATAIAKATKNVLAQAAGVMVFRCEIRSGYVEPEKLATLGDPTLTYNTRFHPFRVSAGAFFQVNRYLVEQLVSIVAHKHSGDLALDLYAGVGLFSVALSQNFAQIVAVELSPTAYPDLLYNSKSNVGAVHARSDQFLKDTGRKLRPDLVVVDPPRSGLGEVVVRRLGVLGARQITYVSCDPATLSRDLAGLLNAGYRIQRAHVVDLFPQTFHIESVFELVRST
jgi:23S rRNA (uracil1939-C5)-methyltransferase